MKRASLLDFFPPRETPAVLLLLRLISRFTTRLFLRIYSCEISNEDLRRLRSLVRHRALLLPNHPLGSGDPAVMFEVAGLEKRVRSELDSMWQNRRPLEGL